MALVQIPPVLRRLTGGLGEVQVEGASVRQVIDQLDVQFPGLKARLVQGDALRPGLMVVVDSRISAVGLLEQVQPHSEVLFLPSTSGG